MIRHALHGLLNAVLLLVLLMIGAAALVQTEPGKRFLASQLSSWLSTPEAGVEITGIQGWIPIDMQIDRLRLSDRSGVWLDAADIALDWTPSALFGGRAQIDAVRAKRLHMARLPEGAEDTEDPATEPFRLPPLPTSLPPVTVTELRIEDIDLDAPVLGEAARFELDGSLTAADDGRHADLTLDLQRIDQASAYLTLTSTIDLDPAMLTIELDAGETGQLLENLTGRADAGDLDLVLTGKGPLDDWSGQLSVRAAGLGKADADLALALVERPHIEMDAVLRPADRVLPADIDGLIGDSLLLNLALTQTKAQAVDVGRLDIEADQVGFKATGQVDFDLGDLTLSAAFDAPALQAFSEMAGITLGGEAGATLAVDGTLQEPRGVLHLRGSRLLADGIEIAGLETRIEAIPTAPLDSGRAEFSIRATGSAEGLALPDTPLPDDNVAWTADLGLPLDGAVTLHETTIETAGAALLATGTIDPKTLISDLDLKLTAGSVRTLAAPYGQDFGGKASIDAGVRTAKDMELVSIDLAASLNQLEGLPDGADDLIGDNLDVNAAIQIDDFRTVKLGDLTLKGLNAEANGQADLDLESRTLAGEVETTLPRLADLSPLIGQPIDGALDLNATIGGNVDAPDVDLTLTSRDLIVAEEPIEALTLDLTGKELLTTPEGRLQLGLAARTTPLSLALNYRLDGETILTLKDIKLDAPTTALSGDLSIDADTALVSGALQGSSTDLAALQALFHQSLQGSVNLAAELSADQGQQNANLSLKGQSIGGDFGRIGEIDLTAAVLDLLGKPTISATSRLNDYRQDAVKFSAVSLAAKGDPENLAFNLDLDGDVIEPLSLEASASLSLADQIKLDVDRLSGAYAGEPLYLNEPFLVEQGEESLTLANLDLRLGQASLKGDVDIGQRDASGSLKLRDLPLSWLELLDGPALDGMASADIDLGGTVDNPNLSGLLELKTIRSETMTTDLPPTDVTIRADLEEGRLASNLVVNGLTERAITANAVHPALLKLRPFAFELPEDGRIEGAAKAEVSLARIGDLLMLDGQIMSGNLKADVTLGGTIKTPLVDGPVSLEKGRYENIFSGTILRNIELAARASNERLTIEQMSAMAGDDGLLDAEGWIEIDPAAHFPISIELSMNEAEIVSRDDAEATISGEIAMLGDLKEARIEGDLYVNRAEFSIPDGGGSDLPVIDVEEVGGVYVNIEEPEEEVETEPPFDPDLAITIDLPNKVYVRGRGLESEWEGELTIAGPTSAPRITGNLSVREGYFDFIEKRFEIEKGDIDFNGASPPNPILTIEAAATDGDFKAIVKLDGPADAPRIRLESEPALPEDEVLARLLFNRELSEIGPVEAAKLALALNKLRGGGGFDAFGEIRDALNIDTLDIVSGEDAEDSRVKAGKYLNDDVYVEVEQGAGDDSSRARVEVEILPNLSLEADTGTDNNGGVGVKWRFDY